MDRGCGSYTNQVLALIGAKFATSRFANAPLCSRTQYPFLGTDGTIAGQDWRIEMTELQFKMFWKGIKVRRLDDHSIGIVVGYHDRYVIVIPLTDMRVKLQWLTWKVERI